MTCPNCGSALEPLAPVCGACGMSLEWEETDDAGPAPWEDALVPVLVSSDTTLLAVARSLLEAHGVPCAVRGELVQDLLGWGRLLGGRNIVTGPAALEVPREREVEARELLAAVNVAPPLEAEGER